jgi:hypothetical protein
MLKKRLTKFSCSNLGHASYIISSDIRIQKHFRLDSRGMVEGTNPNEMAELYELHCEHVIYL